MKSPRSTIRKFNPGVLQSDDDLIRQFVVRRDELDAVLEVLRDNTDAASCQHVLVVGPRGQGKTMLLARVAAELRTNSAFTGLLPVRFMEESHEVSCIGDFWLETLFYLAHECAATAPDLAEELRAAHTDLARAWRDRDYSDRTRATVLAAADQLGKQLVLMVENLQDLCGGVDEDFGWQLRESLQMEPAVMLLATATSRFKMLEDAREPFFELFMTIALEPLRTEECRRLWQIASGEPVEPRGVRPLEILTGGSPRLLTIVAELARHQSVRRLMEDLVALVDDHTDYFRSHLEALPKTERRVYVATISLWQPSSTSEIAAQARMNVRTASSMLGRLVARGALVATGRDRRRRYAATERLYCLYYKIRRERNEADVVQMLIRFMAIFYSKARRPDMNAKLLEEIRQDSLIRRAMIDVITGDSDVLDSAPEAAIAAIDQEMSTTSIDSSAMATLMQKKLPFLHRLQKYNDMKQICEAIIERFGTTNKSECRYAVAIARVAKGLAMQNMNNAEEAIAAYDDFIRTYIPNDETLDVLLTAIIRRASLHIDLGRHRQKAFECFATIVKRYGQDKRPFVASHVALAMMNMGKLQSEIQDTWKEGLKTWRDLIDRFASSDDPYIRSVVAQAYIMIVALLKRHDRAEEVLATLDEAAKYIEDGDETEDRAYEPMMLLLKGWAQRHLGRNDDALESYDELNSRFGDIVEFGGLPWRWHAARERVVTLYDAGMTDQWREALRRLYAMLDDTHEVALADLHGFVVFLASLGAAPNVLAEELATDGDKEQALWPLVVALRRRAGEPVRAPAEVMDVADDILREIDNQHQRQRNFSDPSPEHATGGR